MKEKAEARRERKPREEVGLGAWIQPYHLLGPLQTYPSPLPVLLTGREEKMGASSSCTLPSPGLEVTIDSVCFRGLQDIGWESEEEAVQSSLSVIREIKDRFHRPQPTSMCSMN